jgi:hypothetical protein
MLDDYTIAAGTAATGATILGAVGVVSAADLLKKKKRAEAERQGKKYKPGLLR